VPGLRSFAQDNIFPQTPFYNIAYKSTAGTLSTYQAKTKDNVYQFNIALDSAKKIQTFFARPWADEGSNTLKYKRQQVMIPMRMVSG
jgi:hypothetical protein